MFNCEFKDKCPYLNYSSAAGVLAEKAYLSQRFEEMEKTMRLAETEIRNLRERIKLLETEKQEISDELNRTIRQPFKANKGQSEPETETVIHKKGAPVGHRGGMRPKPTKIDEYIVIVNKECRHCHSENILNYDKFEEHIIEDIVVQTKTTAYQLHYGYCLDCHKTLYAPLPPEITRKGHIGPLTRAMSEYLHYIGVPYLKIKQIFTDIFGLNITHPSLIRFDKNIAKNGEKIYEQIKQAIRLSDWIYVDETGWRAAAINHWLWDFCNHQWAFYRIEKSRGQDIVKDTLGEKYKGILISDFYSAYNPIVALAKQKCIGHLLAEIKDIEKNKLNSQDVPDLSLCQQLKSTLKSGIDYWHKFKTGEKTLDELKIFKQTIAQQLTKFILAASQNKDIQRIQKRLVKYNNEILTFLEYPKIEPTNNTAERQLRLSVIIRKITFGNRSPCGAKNHAIMMTVIQTASLHKKRLIDVLLALASSKTPDLSLLTG